MNRESKEGRRMTSTVGSTSGNLQDTDQGYNPTGADSTSVLYSLLCIIAVLGVSFNEPADAHRMHSIQYITLLIVTFTFLYFASGLNKPTQAAEEQQQQELQQAISLAGNTGVTQEWYDQMGTLLNKITTVAVIALVIIMLDSIRISSPLSVWEHFAQSCENQWVYLLNTYSQKTLFVWGTFLGEFTAFWVVGLGYAYLDLYLPPLMVPFKVQQNFVLSREDFLLAVRVALRNQALVLVVVYFLWDIYPLLSPDGFDPKLPNFGQTIFALAACLPFSEIWFFTTHIFLHRSDWLWSHIHYVHHEWLAPIAITCIYSHWAEHIFVNIVTVMLGPFILGSHLVIWVLYGALAIISTSKSHSGWHLPFLGSTEYHNYHHLTGWGNFGVAGIMDTYFGFNYPYATTWHALIDQNYSNQMYPVQKVLAANGQLSDETKPCMVKDKETLREMQENGKKSAKIHKD